MESKHDYIKRIIIDEIEEFIYWVSINKLAVAMNLVAFFYYAFMNFSKQ